ncbi:ATP-binding protein [Ilumatobacter sp.]|uniref:DNA polymerase III subunit n=1 Tax=Ilumatobacter sp. TaxID=1967498 RepID=UPI0030B3C09C
MTEFDSGQPSDDDMTEEQLEAAMLADEQAAAAPTTPDAPTSGRPELGDPGSVWDDVVGQKPAVEHLRAAAARGPVHAYLFVGPAGSTKLEAARAFAASLMSSGEDREQRDARLILAGEHPDVREVHRIGASISADQAKEVVRVSSLAPTEGARKVLILDEFHLLSPNGAAMMLKTIEEPPDSTMFIILCDFIPHDLITISSRCARIDFRTIGADVIAARLLTEGINPAGAMVASKAALGNLDRARVLATDPALAQRRKAFLGAPGQLDGTGAVAMRLAGELLALIDAAAAPLAAKHESEIVDLDARIKEHGERGSGKKQLEDRHKRELRRHRTDELRSGLATLASVYRDQALASTTPGSRGFDIAGCADAVAQVHRALEAMDRNPNERLLLESLLWSLPVTNGAAA